MHPSTYKNPRRRQRVAHLAPARQACTVDMLAAVAGYPSLPVEPEGHDWVAAAGIHSPAVVAVGASTGLRAIASAVEVLGPAGKEPRLDHKGPAEL